MSDKNNGSQFTAETSSSDFDDADNLKIAKFAMDATMTGQKGFVIDIQHSAFDGDRQFFKSQPWRQYRVRPFDSAELEAISISVNAVPPTGAQFTIMARKNGELCSLWSYEANPPRDTDSQIAVYLRSRGIELEPRL